MCICISWNYVIGRQSFIYVYRPDISPHDYVVKTYKHAYVRRCCLNWVQRGKLLQALSVNVSVMARRDSRRKPASSYNTVRHGGFYAARKNPHDTKKNTHNVVDWKLRRRSAKFCHRLNKERLRTIDPNVSSLRTVIHERTAGSDWVDWYHLESLLLTAEAAGGRGGILSLTWSRNFASENPLILCVGEWALNTRTSTDRPHATGHISCN